MKLRLRDWFRSKHDPPGNREDANGEALKMNILQEDQLAQLGHDMSLLDDRMQSLGQRLQKEVEKEVQTAAEDSLKKLHVIQRGHCPKCGEHLRRHLFATFCDGCGWHTYDVPRLGPVRVHLADGKGAVEGERCYVITSGAVLVLRKDVVVARVPPDAVSWVEYLWNEDEIEQRHKQVLDQMEILCGWCNQAADPDKDGFHLCHVAFGGAQERYCFCSDECYEAFRKMYPARVHRNCYERNCADCNLCIKRYGDEAEGVHMLAKDFLKPDFKGTKKS